MPVFSNAQWTRKSDALRKRGECPSVLYKGKIYVFGGFGEHPNFESANEVYDASSDKWDLRASFPSGKTVTHQGVALIDDKIWHVGGRATNADGPVTSQVLIYDITNDSWSAGPELKDPANGQPLPLGGGGAALIGRTLHVFGGFAPSICGDQSIYHLTLDVDKWLADPLNTSWENKRAPMPIPRNHLNTVVLGGRIYALGGQFGHDCGGADQKYCHVYDPVTDTWTRLTDLPAARSHAEGGIFPVDGKIFMVGGQGASDVAQNTVLVFNPETNNGLGSWSDATEFQLPNNYYGISAKVVDNTFMISHGALTNITNERLETYTAPISRSIPYKFGFVAPCLSKTVKPGYPEVVKNLLFTVEGEKQYTLSSNAAWLTLSKNETGTAVPSAVEIEATIDASNLAPGEYAATITATGAGEGPGYTNGSFCVNIVVLSEADSHILSLHAIGNGALKSDPDQTVFAKGYKVTINATPALGYELEGWSGDASGSTNPLNLTMDGDKNITATFTKVQQPGGFITNITAASGKLYTQTDLVIWAKTYTDRTYQVTSIPTSLGGALLLQTANDDKFSTSSNALSFNMTQSGTIYVAYDPRATTLPSWLSDWQKLTDRVGVDDSKISYMDIYSKSFQAGTVTLGGNMQSPASGAQNNYFVIAKAGAVQATGYTLTLNTTGSGTVSKSPNQSSYAAGTEVTLTAAPAPGYAFSGWSGDASGTANPLKLTMDATKAVNATFTQSQITATNLINAGGAQYTDGAGRSWSADANFTGGLTKAKSFDVAGTLDDQLYLSYRYAASGAPFSYSIPAEAGTYTVRLHFLEPYYGAPGGVAGGAGKRVFHVDVEGQRVLSSYDIFAQDGAGKAVVKTFQGVSVSDGALHIAFSSLKDNAIISAIEIGRAGAPTTYTLDVSTAGSGTVSKSPNQSSYAAGTEVTLTAAPAAGYAFSGWSGDASGTAYPLKLTMDANKSVTATFTPVQQASYTLTVTTTGSGTVLKDPDQELYVDGSSVTLTATPAAGYAFAGWSGDATGAANPLSLTVSSDLSITATFTQVQQTSFTLAVITSGSGTVTKNPDQESYDPGTELTLTATPTTGYEFVGWGGDASGSANVVTLTMNADKAVTASFTEKLTTLRINAGGIQKDIAGITWIGCPASTSCNSYVSEGNAYKMSSSVAGVPANMDNEIFETGWTNTNVRNAKKNSVAFTYTIPVTNGDYLVQLYFAELEKTSAGQRVFDVNIEGGKKELSGFDISREAGTASAVMREIPMRITDGTVTIDFIRQVDNPIISAIAIVPATAAATSTAAVIAATEETNAARMVKVYPNPNTGGTGYVDIANFGIKEAVNLSLYSVTGQKLYETTAATDERGAASTEMKFGTQLRRGVYIIRAVSASGAAHTRLLIE
ncbi:InlB B-repeat-containing protein [Pontibacter saemangeumensis]